MEHSSRLVENCCSVSTQLTVPNTRPWAVQGSRGTPVPFLEAVEVENATVVDVDIANRNCPAVAEGGVERHRG